MQLAVACDGSALEQLEPFGVFESWHLSHGEFAEKFRRFVGHMELYGRCFKLKARYRGGGENLSMGK